MGGREPALSAGADGSITTPLVLLGHPGWPGPVTESRDRKRNPVSGRGSVCPSPTPWIHLKCSGIQGKELARGARTHAVQLSWAAILDNLLADYGDVLGNGVPLPG